MGSRKEIMKVRNHALFLSSFKRSALACVALLMAFAALAVIPAFADDDETIINAGLSGAVLNGQRPSGKAEFRQRPGNDLKLEVEVQDVNLPAGTVLNVFVNNQPFGTITLNSFRAGEVERETERGESVPQVNIGTPVVVTNQAGAVIVSGVFGTNPTPAPSPDATPTATPTPGATPSPTATPGATPSPSPTPGATPNPTPTATPTPGATPSPSPTPGATPSPSPTPGATPSPTPANFEIRAHLTGAAIGGVTPTGRADFEVEFGNREFKVRVEDVNLPRGTSLNVFVDGVRVGALTLDEDGRGEFRLKTEDGQAVPTVNSRTRVVVSTQAGLTIVAGSFSNIQQLPTDPGPAPMPTPGPGGELRIEARLAGAAIGGLVPRGHARFRSQPGRRDFNVEVEKVNLPLNTVLGVFVDGVKLGDLVLRSTLENELELNTNDGQFVPDLTTASRVVVTNAQGLTVLSGVFNTAGLNVSGNDIDNTTLFVEQQYRDFLDREPDDGGLSFWSGEIGKCGGDPSCVDGMRANTSAAFFLSIEFQETGYMLYRFNKASFGVMPRRNDFLVEMQAAAQGLVVGAPGWQARLEDNKRLAAERWVASAAFRNIYGGMSNEQYVDALFANAGLATGTPERFSLVQGLNAGTETRATVLRKVADNVEFRKKESNPAFVLMQYFGYLHRNPDEGPDADMRGFNFWLKKLDDNAGDFHRAQMVKAFIDSIEYRNRFEW